MAAYVKRQSEQASTTPDAAGTAAAGAAVGTHGYNNYLINPYSAPTVDQGMTHSPSHPLAVGASAGFGVSGVGGLGLISAADVGYASGWNGYGGGANTNTMQSAAVGRPLPTADHTHHDRRCPRLQRFTALPQESLEASLANLMKEQEERYFQIPTVKVRQCCPRKERCSQRGKLDVLSGLMEKVIDSNLERVKLVRV